MSKARRNEIAVVIASDAPAEAALVRSLLEDEFAMLNVCMEIADARIQLRIERPRVIVLAFKDITRAEHFCLELLRLQLITDRARQRLIALCTGQEVKEAYERCRRGIFDDYVLFWPATHDVTRLQLAVHRAMSELLDHTPRRAPSEPAAVAAADVQQSAPATASAPAPPGMTAHGPTVLVVDDDDFQRALSGRILQAEGYQALFADSGAVALQMLLTQRSRPDVVLLDIQMPDMDGLTVLAQCKSVPLIASIPVIMVTGNNERDVVVRALRLGAVDFIVKPFASQALLSKLARTTQALPRVSGA